MRHKIIIVDDNISSLKQGQNMLKTFYDVFPVPSAAILFEILQTEYLPTLFFWI